jgi:tetratricopeptide (TPR) repeat protein
LTRWYVEVILVFLLFSVPGCASYYRQQYDLYSRIGDWEGAEQALREGLVSNPNDPEIYFLLGQVYGHRGKYTELDMAFSRSLTISKDLEGDIDRYREVTARRQVNRGIELYNQGQYRQAIHVLSEVMKIRKDETQHYPYLGLCYSALGEYAESKRHLILSMELNGDELSMLELTRLNHVMGDSRGVIQVSERFLSHHTERIEILRPLAMAYESEGLYSDAVSTYREILKVDPDDQSARFNLALLLSKQGHTSEAIPLMEELKSQGLGDPELRFKICSLLYETGRYEASLVCFQEYSESNPGDLEALEYLFVLNWNLGRWGDIRGLRRMLDQPSLHDSTSTEEGYENP